MAYPSIRPDPTRRRWLAAALAAAGLPAVRAEGFASYPERPVALIVPYGAGGGADSRARQIAQPLSAALGQPVVVDNKPGAGGNLGTELIARAKPDGYTLGMGNFAPLAVNKALFRTLRFDPAADLLPIVLLDRGPLVLMVNQASPFRSVSDVVQAAMGRPGTLTFASGGIGGTHHLSGELFQQVAGIKLIHVPYKSGAAATTDLMAGNVDVMFEQMYSAMPNIRSGRLRPIAITSAIRLARFPAIPTFAEQGYAGVEIQNWQGLVAPKGTPADILDRINRETNRILRDRATSDAIEAQGNEVGGGSPGSFASLIAAESDRWAKVVRQANIKPE